MFKNEEYRKLQMCSLCVKRIREWIRRKHIFSLIIIVFIIFSWKSIAVYFSGHTGKVYLHWRNYHLSANFHSQSFNLSKSKNKNILEFSKSWKFLHDSASNPFLIYNNCDMRWLKKDAIPWFNKNGRTDVETSFISIWDIRPAGEFSRVMLQTQYPNGTQKKYGGDFWRCYVKGTTSVPVSKKDFWNGSYEFKFLLMEAGNYTLGLSLEYTLCDGIKEPPPDWFVKGMCTLNGVITF